MARKSINRKANIRKALDRCRKQEKKLTRAGVQAGNIHFKTDRPNSMFVYEPQSNGGRKYVHVGVDLNKQREMRKKVERWQRCESLQKAILQLEEELGELEYRLGNVVMYSDLVAEHAAMIIDKYVRGE